MRSRLHLNRFFKTPMRLNSRVLFSSVSFRIPSVEKISNFFRLTEITKFIIKSFSSDHSNNKLSEICYQCFYIYPLPVCQQFSQFVCNLYFFYFREFLSFFISSEKLLYYIYIPLLVLTFDIHYNLYQIFLLINYIFIYISNILYKYIFF